MRNALLVLPLALMASPVLAQARPAPPETIAVPRELTDPAMAERLGRMMQAMSQAFLNLPVGEIEAAAEGRAPTAADKRRTVRDAGRMDDPNFDRNFQAHLADGRAGMQAGMAALAKALPAMMKGLSEAGRELEKATANLPNPNYPKR